MAYVIFQKREKKGGGFHRFLFNKPIFVTSDMLAQAHTPHAQKYMYSPNVYEPVFNPTKQTMFITKHIFNINDLPKPRISQKFWLLFQKETQMAIPCCSHLVP